MNKIAAILGDSNSNGQILKRIKDFGPFFYAIVFGFTYISGFVVLNSNLARSDVLDIEFVNARYLLAGSNFLFYLVCFYLFAGRAALLGPRWFERDLHYQQELRLNERWKWVIFLHSFTHFIFFCCLSAATYTFFAIKPAETKIFNATLAGAFLILFFIDRLDAEIRTPRTALLVKTAVKLVSVYAFFAVDQWGSKSIVFVNYLGIMFFLSMTAYVSDRYERDLDHFSFTTVYTIFFVLVSAITYGTQLFGQVSPKLGGARPINVAVGVSEVVAKALPQEVAPGDHQILEGALIHQTSSHIYLLSKGRMIRLRVDDVIATTSKPELENDGWKDLIDRLSITDSLLPNTK